jgi:hypothetical protein
LNRGDSVLVLVVVLVVVLDFLGGFEDEDDDENEDDSAGAFGLAPLLGGAGGGFPRRQILADVLKSRQSRYVSSRLDPLNHPTSNIQGAS